MWEEQHGKLEKIESMVNEAEQQVMSSHFR